MTHGVKVPEQYKPDKRQIRADVSYVIDCIHDVIKANPRHILKIEDFIEISGVSTAGTALKELMRQNRVVRYKVKTGFKGHQYTYEWRDTAEPLPTTVRDMEYIQAKANEFNDKLAEENLSEQVTGVIKFVKYLRTLE